MRGDEACQVGHDLERLAGDHGRVSRRNGEPDLGRSGELGSRVAQASGGGLE